MAKKAKAKTKQQKPTIQQTLVSLQETINNLAAAITALQVEVAEMRKANCALPHYPPFTPSTGPFRPQSIRDQLEEAARKIATLPAPKAMYNNGLTSGLTNEDLERASAEEKRKFADAFIATASPGTYDAAMEWIRNCPHDVRDVIASRAEAKLIRESNEKCWEAVMAGCLEPGQEQLGRDEAITPRNYAEAIKCAQNCQYDTGTIFVNQATVALLKEAEKAPDTLPAASDEFRAAAEVEAATPITISTPQHICGLRGYTPWIDPPCPACVENSKAVDLRRS